MFGGLVCGWVTVLIVLLFGLVACLNGFGLHMIDFGVCGFVDLTLGLGCCWLFGCCICVCFLRLFIVFSVIYLFVLIVVVYFVCRFACCLYDS